MRIEYAELSLVGDRDNNQNRVTVAVRDQAVLMLVIDGMGGHSDGSRAADTAPNKYTIMWFSNADHNSAHTITHTSQFNFPGMYVIPSYVIL